MSGINMGKVIVGGLVAGLVMNAIDFAVNVPWLGPQWEAATVARGVDPTANAGLGAAGWITSDFLFGIGVVWLYAAIRPRFGPGPKTAVIAGVALWAIKDLAYCAMWFTGMYPLNLLVMSGIGGLVATVAAAWVGARIYTEAPSAHSARV
ncbi:MAG: hypothetical protein ACRD09_10675 [Vicinamibacterales bacterium]